MLAFSYFFDTEKNNDFYYNKIDKNQMTSSLEEELKLFEKGFQYPLGKERTFTISHGTNANNTFLSFFKDLGDPYILTARNKRKRFKNGIYYEKDELACLSSIILRTFTDVDGRSTKAWYICSLKTKPKYQKMHIPRKMYFHYFYLFYPYRIYSIAMNDIDMKTLAERIWKKTIFNFFYVKKTLFIFNLTYSTIKKHRNLIEQICHGPISFKSCKGKKNFEISEIHKKDSTKEWTILHIQHGLHQCYDNEIIQEPKENFDHLISAFEHSMLKKKLESIPNIIFYGTATIISFNFDLSIFNDSILTDQI